MYKSILVPIDPANAERGKAMIARARALADDGARILLLSVIETVPGYVLAELPSGLMEDRAADADADLEAIAKEAGGGLQTMVRTGKPSTEIMTVAEDEGADLIIVASHNPGMQDYFLGSNAARVVRHAQCSVLVDR